jgi:hypothetical protein
MAITTAVKFSLNPWKFVPYNFKYDYSRVYFAEKEKKER